MVTIFQEPQAPTTICMFVCLFVSRLMTGRKCQILPYLVFISATILSIMIAMKSYCKNGCLCNYQWDGKEKVTPNSEKIWDIGGHELQILNKVLMGQHIPQHFNPNLIAKLKYAPIISCNVCMYHLVLMYTYFLFQPQMTMFFR